MPPATVLIPLKIVPKIPEVGPANQPPMALPIPGNIKDKAREPNGPNLPKALAILPKPFFSFFPIFLNTLPICFAFFLNHPISLTTHLLKFRLPPDYCSSYFLKKHQYHFLKPLYILKSS